MGWRYSQRKVQRASAKGSRTGQTGERRLSFISVAQLDTVVPHEISNQNASTFPKKKLDLKSRAFVRYQNRLQALQYFTSTTPSQTVTSSQHGKIEKHHLEVSDTERPFESRVPSIIRLDV